jgi:5-methylcytosine-specific restriction endonuclease McrA
MPKVKCGSCLKFIEKDSAKKMGIQNFCQTCYPKNKKSTPKPGVTASLREEVMNADGNRCRRCGANSNLHVHHIVYRSGGGKHERQNLITLCLECHAQVHSDKGKYQELCFAVVVARDAFGDKQTLISKLEIRKEL